MPSAVPLGALALLILLPGAAEAQTSGFSALSGSWSGSGSVTLTSGAVERIRCKATYEVALSGNNFQQNLRCRSDSYDFNLRASIVRSGDSVGGTWIETTRNANGGISGRISGNQIQGPGLYRQPQLGDPGKPPDREHPLAGNGALDSIHHTQAGIALGPARP